MLCTFSAWISVEGLVEMVLGVFWAGVSAPELTSSHCSSLQQCARRQPDGHLHHH